MRQKKNAGFYVESCGGVPTLFHGGAPFPAAAYMTYLEEYGRFEDFARAGYRLFSFPALFAGKWISVTEGLRPFSKGIFDGETPDYSVFDASVRRILAACPEAYLIPRVNLSMPDRWLMAHKDALDGTGARESLFSGAWLRAAEEMLRALIAHVAGADYRDRVAGYHLAAGNTEEWFHFDMNAVLSPVAEAGFAAFLRRKYPGMPFEGLPDLTLLNGTGPRHGSQYLAAYLDYANTAVAEAVVRLARAAKDAAGSGVLVGAFFGYTLEVTSPLYGNHALTAILESDAVDFISSPNSYIGVRAPHADWTEMYAADSVRLHGKLCFQECDIRTHLTKPLGAAAPEYDPRGLLSAPIWHGLKDRETAIGQIRKSFCRQLVKGNGFWWFDMWGGWYADERIMAQMARFKEIFAAALSVPARGSVAETAVFVDETANRLMTDCARRSAVHEQRMALGHMGAPYDIYDVSDFPAVFGRYKAAVFVTGVVTDGAAAAMETCERHGVPYLTNTGPQTLFSAARLAAFCAACGVHLYCAPGDIVYVNAQFVAVHAVTGGEKLLRFPRETTLTDLLDGAPELRGREIALTLRAGETRLFLRKTAD